MDEHEASQAIIELFKRSGLTVPESVAVVASLLVSGIMTTREVGERMEAFEAIVDRMRETLQSMDKGQMQ